MSICNGSILQCARGQKKIIPGLLRKINKHEEEIKRLQEQLNVRGRGVRNPQAIQWKQNMVVAFLASVVILFYFYLKSYGSVVVYHKQSLLM